MNPLLEGVIEGIEDGIFVSLLQSYCQHWKEHPTQYAIAFVIRHAIESDQQQLVYDPLADPDFRKRRSTDFGMNALLADIRSALDYFSLRKQNLLRYYQLLSLGQQIEIHHSGSKYQNYCQIYLQFLQLNEPPNARENIGISRVLNRRFPMEVDGYQRRRHRIELLSYEIGDWRCRCGARQGHAQRYDWECKVCKETGNGLIDRGCPHCKGSITYMTCAECNTRVTLAIVWRIENGDLHPRELSVPLQATLRRFVDGSPRDTLSLTLLQIPLMFGIHEKSGTFHVDSPGLFWAHNRDDQRYSIWVFGGDIKYDRQTDPLKIFEHLLSRTFSPYLWPQYSLKSRLQQEDISRVQFTGGFTRGFLQRITQIAQGIPATPTDFSFDCLVSASKSLTHNMAILNRSSTKNLVAPYMSEASVVLGPDDILTRTPLRRVISTNLDENGIVVVGTLVNPGDVLVGIAGRDEISAEAKLLKAIFGESAKLNKKIDSSCVYNGIFPARVRSVDVTTDKTQISIGLSVEASIEVGDILYGDNDTEAIICQIANGDELKKLAGCTREPDLIVSPNHPWTKILPGQVSIKPDTLIGYYVNVRASGYYTPIYEQPTRDVSYYNRAQVITKDDFSWLLHYNLMDCVFELLQMHSDPSDRRSITYHISKSGCVSLRDIEKKSFNPPTDLVKAPGETMRYLAFLLRGLGIRVTIEFTPKPCMVFHIMQDADRSACSHGEVTTAKDLDTKTRRPFQGGILCERIFGPIIDVECACGKYKGAMNVRTVCDECGVEVISSRVRRERMGHIELTVPVINPLYLDHVCNVLSGIFSLEANDIRSLIYYRKSLIFKEGNRKKMFSLSDNDQFSLRRKQRNWENEPLSGAIAVQKLLEHCVSSSEAIQYHLFPEKVIMKKVLVIPPSLRPNSSLNDYYHKVIRENNRLARNLHSWYDCALPRALQEAVDRLFISKVDSTWNLRSFIEAVTPLKDKYSTLLDMLLTRPLDYTAQTRITAESEHIGDIDLAFLPETLAYQLFRPFIMRKTRSKSNSDGIVENDSKDDKNTTMLDCGRLAILVSIDSSPFRFIALRFQLAHDLTLKVHSDLLDLLGWELLGKSARIFALFSDEAIEEALGTLTPSKLLQQKSPTTVSDSVLDVAKEEIVSFITTKALLQESVPIGPYEWFLTLPLRYPKTE